MEKQLKVITGLECCRKSTNQDPFQECKKCPYNEISISVQDCRAVLSADALELLKERQQIVRCKDCKYVECEGVEGFLVCDLSGFSHSPEFFCADGERK